MSPFLSVSMASFLVLQYSSYSRRLDCTSSSVFTSSPGFCLLEKNFRNQGLGKGVLIGCWGDFQHPLAGLAAPSLHSQGLPQLLVKWLRPCDSGVCFPALTSVCPLGMDDEDLVESYCTHVWLSHSGHLVSCVSAPK